MSLKVSCIVPHRLTTFEQIVELPLRLRSFSKIAWRVADAYWGKPTSRDEGSDWTLCPAGPPGRSTAEQDWNEGKLAPRIRFPAGIWINLGYRCFEIGSIAKL